MKIVHRQTNLSKEIDFNGNYSVWDLHIIYKFYSEHKDFDIYINGKKD